jgi:hypothetical protein
VLGQFSLQSVNGDIRELELLHNGFHSVEEIGIRVIRDPAARSVTTLVLYGLNLTHSTPNDLGNLFLFETLPGSIVIAFGKNSNHVITVPVFGLSPSELFTPSQGLCGWFFLFLLPLSSDLVDFCRQPGITYVDLLLLWLQY